MQLVVSPSAAERRAAARARVIELVAAGEDVLILSATRAAADELAADIARERGGLFGVARAGFHEFITRLALPRLAAKGLSPTGALGDEAVVTRASFEAADAEALHYFGPVARLPGFPRAAARTLTDIRLGGVDAKALATVPTAGADLAELLARVEAETSRAGTVGRAAVLREAAAAVTGQPALLGASHLVVLDVGVTSTLEELALRALIGAASSALVTIPDGDAGAFDDRSRDVQRSFDERSTTALARLQRHLFADEAPPEADGDESVVLFSAPGEGREAVEMARRMLDEARRGVRFDEMAVIVRAPQTYLGVVEHALERAGIPAWFHRGTRRPDPAGRAFLALLACASEGLSARRFAEYVSLGQVPDAGPPSRPEAATARSRRSSPDAPRAEADATWSGPTDEDLAGIVPLNQQEDDEQPDEERAEASGRGETDRDVAGTLRAPWRWEDLLVEAAVIGGLDRWRRRLEGLANDYARRLREVESDDPESSRTRALRRDVQQLGALRAFAEPVLEEMAAWPADQIWGDWLRSFEALAARVLARPARVLRVLQELAPLSTVGPVGLNEVRALLTPRLSTLTHEPPRRRHGRVFVGTPHAARGRAFRVVFVPGLAERLFPQRLREDALLADESRHALDAGLVTQARRAADERLQLKLAVGAASERVYLSYPRIELQESRPRVPSFYVLDTLRASEGRIPAAASIGDRAHKAGGATLAWPAPTDATTAIDDFEHDLSTMAALLKSTDPSAAKGRARYLYELSPALQRSLTSRWLRWHRRGWETADGLVRRIDDTTGPALAKERLNARPYSLTALQRFAACPYQFLLGAIYRLAPLEQPAPLQRLDPLTRGDLFHRIQAATFRRLEKDGLLPLTADHLPRAQKMLEWAVTAVDKEAFDELAPAIERVWRDEIGAMTRDLKIWLEKLAEEGAEWTPERFEYSFGLDDTAGRDERSTKDTARISQAFQLRGSIDVVERHRQTRLLRVTDNKTGKNRTTRGATIVDGGRVLQPVVYGLALEALWPDEQVYSGRLFFCTSNGHFDTHEIPLLTEARKVGLEALQIIDRSIERGLLAARPAEGACEYCDFLDVCGRDEERRTRRKEPSRFADLDALRKLP